MGTLGKTLRTVQEESPRRLDHWTGKSTVVSFDQTLRDRGKVIKTGGSVEGKVRRSDQRKKRWAPRVGNRRPIRFG